MVRWLPVGALVLQALPWSAAQDGSRQLPAFTIDALVGGWNGPGWWSLKADSAGRIEVIGDSSSAPDLTSPQVAELQVLITRLPHAEARYEFGPKTIHIDGDPIYKLSVASGGTRTEYWFVADLGESDRSEELASVLRVWIFLRGLFVSDKAVDDRESFRAWLESAPGGS